ncbi:hypothetical protein SAMN04487950_1653 [Halogranum rubrum]|uniref:Lipoprotein n=1 Tax=Halogranum rubrum TaxID=553466 RepID=A0A1I4D6M8_9EURY|nr:hypothetical protein [Halogranum rubrum]SFK88785.1 hypothetical protein SAMN04487950_1653 [Halogranum rubrum]
MNRRTALSTIGIILSMGTAGCLFTQSKPEPRFTLRDVRSYLVDEETALVVGVVEKQGGTTGNVTVRAELLIDDAYNHVSTQTFVIPAELTKRTIALPFTTDSSYYGEQQFTARAKVIREGELDGEWVAESK